MSNDPEFLWESCETCHGEGTILDGEFDVDCPACDGDGGFER